MQDYEKLGAFYLGKEYDLEADELMDDLVMYDAKDLTTHGVCVGMTGSGKTGLCIGLLEEAAIDGIPSICIDPKGDLGNLMLTFPDLEADSFRPWIDESEAARKQKSPDEFAESTAAMWKKGLADWGQGPDRIQRLRDAAEVSIYTPGSSAGRQVTVLKSFDAPPREVMEDHEAMQERTTAAVSGLFALLGVKADAVDREHILLANILNHSWMDGKSLKLADIIRQIQKPPFSEVGVFDLESFYPASDRMKLALQMNGLLASPSFAVWMKGEPLDIQQLLYTPEGKPKVAIMSIAHLDDNERMFFVTILLNEILSWMRAQPGTNSLRALLYMDEIFGYFPPSANPPSKQPMLTLLKQARAFGLGVMMATQNPVDLDYKGLSNCGTWFIGRLQTERDKLRVLDGLESASAEAGDGFDRSEMDKILSSVGSRKFLLHNVHDNAPTIFHTRWVMSYLRGPMTRDQIEKLMDDKKAAIPARAPRKSHAAAIAEVTKVAAAEEPPEEENQRPALAAGIDEYWMPLDRDNGGSRLVYRPVLGANVRLHFTSSPNDLDVYIDTAIAAPIGSKGRIDWDDADIDLGRHAALEEDEPKSGTYAEAPPEVANKKYYTTWKKELISHLYQNSTLKLHKCKALKLVSKQGESEGAFRGRIAHLAREERDEAMEKLRKKYESKLETAMDRVKRAELKIQKEEDEYRSSKMSSMVSAGASLLGAFMGRRTVSVTNMRRAGSAMRGFGAANKQKGDIGRAEEELANYEAKLRELEEELQDELEEMEDSFDPDNLELETVEIRCTKTHTSINEFGLAWTPWAVDKSGIAEALFEDVD